MPARAARHLAKCMYPLRRDYIEPAEKGEVVGRQDFRVPPILTCHQASRLSSVSWHGPRCRCLAVSTYSRVECGMAWDGSGVDLVFWGGGKAQCKAAIAVSCDGASVDPCPYACMHARTSAGVMPSRFLSTYLFLQSHLPTHPSCRSRVSSSPLAVPQCRHPGKKATTTPTCLSQPTTPGIRPGTNPLTPPGRRRRQL